MVLLCVKGVIETGVMGLPGDLLVRIGAPGAVAHDGNHAAARTLSGAIHGGAPEADMFSVLVRLAVPNTVSDAQGEGLYRVIDAAVGYRRRSNSVRASSANRRALRIAAFMPSAICAGVSVPRY